MKSEEDIFEAMEHEMETAQGDMEEHVKQDPDRKEEH